jgi:hypothetical protein
VRSCGAKGCCENFFYEARKHMFKQCAVNGTKHIIYTQIFSDIR